MDTKSLRSVAPSKEWMAELKAEETEKRKLKKILVTCLIIASMLKYYHLNSQSNMIPEKKLRIINYPAYISLYLGKIVRKKKLLNILKHHVQNSLLCVLCKIQLSREKMAG